MVKVRSKQENDYPNRKSNWHNAGCTSPCECLKERHELDLDNLYDIIKNPEPTKIVIEYNNKGLLRFLHDKITKLFVY